MRSAAVAAAAALGIVAACGGRAPAPPPAPVANVAPPPPRGVVDEDVRAPEPADLPRYAALIPGDGPLVAEIVTSAGPIRCTLAGEVAPMAVANFVGLATGAKAWRDPRSDEVRVGVPFYDGLTFHRVIPDFMIQGGDPVGDGTGGPGYTFDVEADPSLTHGPGALAMAHRGPGTNGSQFYIMDAAAGHLDGGYTVFGQCDELEVVAAIARVPRDRGDKPLEPVVITSVTIRRGP